MKDLSGVFEGDTIVILAGGPSVTLKTIHHIARRRLDLNSGISAIAVNDAVFVAWWADWLHACDARWWRWNVQQVRNFPGIRTTLDEMVPPAWANLLNNTGKDGFDPNPLNCRTGGNGAYQAMHMAVHAGARKLVLVGVDMDRSGHWHQEYKGVASCDRDVVMLPSFETLKPELDRRGIQVVNASLESKLEIWPKLPIEEAL